MEKINLTPKSIIKRNEKDFLYTEVDNETVLMNIHDSSYFGLNEVSTVIWKFLDKGQSVANIISQLLIEYKVEPEKCKKETEIVLKAMLRFKIVEIN